MSITLKKKTPKKIRELKKRFLLEHDPNHNQQFDLLSTDQYDQILAHANTWRIQVFSVPDFDQPKSNILIQISHINFTKLANICIKASDIATIEALAFLQCPLLSILRLPQNLITQLKPLAKCQFPHLYHLWIYANMLNHDQLTFMTRLKSNKDHTKRIELSKRYSHYLAPYYLDKQSPRMEMVTQLIKYESVFLDKIAFHYGYDMEGDNLESSVIMSDRIRGVFDRRSFDGQRKRIYDRFEVQGSNVISC